MDQFIQASSSTHQGIGYGLILVIVFLAVMSCRKAS